MITNLALLLGHLAWRLIGYKCQARLRGLQKVGAGRLCALSCRGFNRRLIIAMASPHIVNYHKNYLISRKGCSRWLHPSNCTIG